MRSILGQAVVSGMLVIVLAAGFSGSTAFAQPSPLAEAKADAEAPPEAEEPPLVTKGQELIARFDEGDARLQELRSEARKASGEQLKVLRRQIGEQRIEILKVIADLVDNVTAQEEAEVQDGALRRRVEGLLERLVPSIISHINAADKQLGRLRKRRETAPEAELFEIEQEIAAQVEWEVTLFRAHADTLDDMEALGMNVEDERADFEVALSEGAESVARRLEYQVERKAQIEGMLAERPEDEDLKLQLASIEARRERTIGTLGVAVRLLERLQLPAAEYQQLLIRATGEMTADIFKKEVALGLVEKGIQWAKGWLRDNGPNYGFKALMFVMTLLMFRVIALLVRFILMRTLASERVDASRLLQNLTSSLVGSVIMMLGLLVALSLLGFELGPILAGLGIAGFIVGFALQDSLGNFAAGVMILGVRPYDVGDMVEAAGAFGKVSDMSLIATTILTIDNQTLVIPNGKIWGGVIRNVTYQKERRVDLTFRIAYTENLDRVEQVVKQILNEDDRVLSEPEPLLKLHKLNEWSVDFVVRPWVKTEDYWDVYWDVTREVKDRFEEQGIIIPLPRGELQLLGSSDPEPSWPPPG